MLTSLDDNRKIGVGLCFLGACCFALGFALLFDRALLTLGNISFMAGLSFLLGPMKTFQFFFRREKIISSIAFFGGVTLIIWGYSFLGFISQVYAVWRLFAAFLPNIFQALRLIPGMSVILSLPGLRQLNEYAYDQRRLPV